MLLAANCGKQAGRIVFPIEAAFDSALAPGKPALENSIHLKSFRVTKVLRSVATSSNTANRRRISSFLKKPTRDVEKPRLFKD